MMASISVKIEAIEDHPTAPQADPVTPDDVNKRIDHLLSVAQYHANRFMDNAFRQQQQNDALSSETPSSVGPVVYTFETLNEMKIHDIKALLRDSKMRITGNKEDLIARILGRAEPSLTNLKKRSAQDMSGTSGNGEEDDDDPSKMIRVDKNDPLFNICFLCQSTASLVKYKNMRQCLKCKVFYKCRRIVSEEAKKLFNLDDIDLKDLPHKLHVMDQVHGAQVPVYAFSTVAGAAVKKFGSLYHLVKDNPEQRIELAAWIQKTREAEEAQTTDSSLLQNLLFEEKISPVYDSKENKESRSP